MGFDYALVWLMAIYGLFSFFITIFKIIGRKHFASEKANLILVVKDQEENIESMVRDAMNSKFVRGITLTGSFIVLDMDSKDDTLKILKRLEQQFPLLEVCSYEDKESLLTKIS